MSVQMCEGIWRMRDGFVTTIYWMPETEGHEAHWGNYLGEWNSDGTSTCSKDAGSEDLVEYLGPIPKTDWSTEIDRLKGEWQTEFTAAQQLRSENERLQAEIERLQTELRGYAAESHRQLRARQAEHDKATATLQAEQRGEREGFRIAISMILEALK